MRTKEIEGLDIEMNLDLSMWLIVTILTLAYDVAWYKHVHES